MRRWKELGEEGRKRGSREEVREQGGRCIFNLLKSNIFIYPSSTIYLQSAKNFTYTNYLSNMTKNVVK